MSARSMVLKPSLSIVIPCYNEAESLPILIQSCAAAVKERDDIEVIFVNNGSTDNSSSVFEHLLSDSRYSFGRLLTLDINRGYGFGIMSGIRDAIGPVVAWTHADLQTDPADVIRAFDQNLIELGNGTVIVKGRRIGRNLFDVFFTAGMSVVTSLLLGKRLTDINAQPKIFSRAIIAEMEQAPEDFSLDVYLLYLARRTGRSIIEIPVKFEDRQYGEAKGGGSLKGKYRITVRTFKFLFQLRKEIRKGLR